MTQAPVSPKETGCIGRNTVLIFNNQNISFDFFPTESTSANTEVTENRTGLKLLTV